MYKLQWKWHRQTWSCAMFTSLSFPQFDFFFTLLARRRLICSSAYYYWWDPGNISAASPISPDIACRKKSTFLMKRQKVCFFISSLFSLCISSAGKAHTTAPTAHINHMGGASANTSRLLIRLEIWKQKLQKPQNKTKWYLKQNR